MTDGESLYMVLMLLPKTKPAVVLKRKVFGLRRFVLSTADFLLFNYYYYFIFFLMSSDFHVFYSWMKEICMF